MLCSLTISSIGVDLRGVGADSLRGWCDVSVGQSTGCGPLRMAVSPAHMPSTELYSIRKYSIVNLKYL